MVKKVTKITVEQDEEIPIKVLVEGEDTIYLAHKVAITAGAFVNHILKPSFGLELDLKIWEMGFAYFEPEPDMANKFNTMWFQFENGGLGDETSNLFYGFPVLPWGKDGSEAKAQDMCRIALDAPIQIISDPKDRKGEVPPEHLKRLQKFIEERMVGLTTRYVSYGTCMQTNVVDNMFVLDYIPKTCNRVAIFTAGWAMKFVPLIGKLLHEMLDGGIRNIRHKEIVENYFSINRPGILKQ